jgi:hypothetical protein
MSFQLAHPDGLRVPRTVEKNLAAAQAFNAGALLLADASDNFAECGADPASIAVVAVSGAGTDTSGFVQIRQEGISTWEDARHRTDRSGIQRKVHWRPPSCQWRQLRRCP